MINTHIEEQIIIPEVDRVVVCWRSLDTEEQWAISGTFGSIIRR